MPSGAIEVTVGGTIAFVSVISMIFLFGVIGIVITGTMTVRPVTFAHMYAHMEFSFGLGIAGEARYGQETKDCPKHDRCLQHDGNHDLALF